MSRRMLLKTYVYHICSSVRPNRLPTIVSLLCTCSQEMLKSTLIYM